MDHVWITDCKTGNCGGSCFVCCCGVCAICGCAEGITTTHCPGYQPSKEVIDAVYAGQLDFVDGWWATTCSPCSPRSGDEEPERTIGSDWHGTCSHCGKATSWTCDTKPLIENICKCV